MLGRVVAEDLGWLDCCNLICISSNIGSSKSADLLAELFLSTAAAAVLTLRRSKINLKQAFVSTLSNWRC